MKTKKILVVLILAHLVSCEVKPSEISPKKTSQSSYLSDTAKRAELQKKEIAKFLSLKKWFKEQHKKNQLAVEHNRESIDFHVKKLKNAINTVYDQAFLLDSENDVSTQQELLLNIKNHMNIAHEIVNQIMPEYWKINEGKRLCAQIIIYLETVDNFVGAFLTGALENYNTQDSDRLSEIIHSISFSLCA